MSLLNRESLKNLFQRGKFPSEKHFGHLIDSTVNKVDDGIGKSARDGLQLSPQNNSDGLISIFERLDQPDPKWQVKLRDDDEAKGLSFEQIDVDDDGKRVSKSFLFFGDNGRVGIGNDQPVTTLDVGGTFGTKTRVGTYKYGMVKGNGEWHPILCNLKGLHAFEIVARIDGPPGRGKYAFTHAFALSTFGGRASRKKIKQIKAHYGWFWNRIDLRWEGDISDYRLMIRTRQHYGKDDEGNLSMIKYHITNLWDDSIFNSAMIPENECEPAKAEEEAKK